jgi:hypothetical protein
MIKINYRFSIERQSRQWVLYDTQKTDNEKSKTGYSTRESYYSRLSSVVDEILERTPSEAGTLSEMVLLIRRVRDDIYGALMGTRSGN